MKKFNSSQWLLLLFVILQSCAIPFSEYQTAKTIGKGNHETSYFVSVYSSDKQSLDDDNKGELVGFPLILLGVNHDKGLLDRVDLRTSFSTNFVDCTLGIAPKVNLIRDKYSITLPIGYEFHLPFEQPIFDALFASQSQPNVRNVFYILPTLLATYQVNKYIDLTVAPKTIFYINEGAWRKPLLASSFGISFHTRNSRFSLRPEFGFSTPLNSIFASGTTGHIGIAFSIRTENVE